MTEQRPITIAIRITARPGHEEEVAAEMHAVLKRVRTEPGCRYIVGHRDPDDSRGFFLFEEWRDRDEFEVFRTTTDYLKDYIARITPVTESLEMSYWQAFA